MLGARVIVICNLPPRKLVGFKSHGMVLCAVQELEEGKEVVEFLKPPEKALPGDRISVENGFEKEPLSAKQCEKQDAWKILSPFLHVKEGVGYWGESKLVGVNGGECRSSRVGNGLLR